MLGSRFWVAHLVRRDKDSPIIHRPIWDSDQSMMLNCPRHCDILVCDLEPATLKFPVTGREPSASTYC